MAEDHNVETTETDEVTPQEEGQNPAPEGEATPDEGQSADEAPAGDEPEGTTDEPEADEVVKSAEENGWEMTGNEAGDAAIQVLNKHLTPEEGGQFFAEAMRTGDLGTIDVQALTEKMGKADADAAMALVRTYHAEALAEFAKTKEAVFEAVGGERVYEALTDWCNSKREANDTVLIKQFDELNVMLNNGGTQAVLAAKQIRALYDADEGTTGLTNNLLVGDSAAATVEKGITREEYVKMRRDAHNAGNEAKFKEAWRLRQVGMKQGL